ncbi:BTAD domain-containing putative transcriptional regulator [Streptomyces sp. NPDC087844]|uniref:AfsR/SARP family transcriptional regulator n=1 Tax=Streptomyces sp. NPDC087844 TaxID=3365805 RepID=UPI003814EEE1
MSDDLPALRLSVLGPVRGWLAGTELDLGPPQQRATLAVLLVRAKRPVPVGDIVDVLWGQDAPPSAANVIHRHVGMLRRLFEPGLSNRAEGQRLVRGSAGYRLRVGVDDVDLSRFRHLRETAREADGAGGPEETVKRLAEALSLWQGPVAAGIPLTARSHRVFTALDREYLTTVREAAETALRHGVPQHVVPVLERCAARYPVDERVHADLALALAATGHQAEALDVCRIVRTRLAEELGVTPGPELRAAHARVLEGGGPARVVARPREDTSATAPPGRALTRRPHERQEQEQEPLRGSDDQLPSASASFVCRSGETALLLALADDTRSRHRTSAVGVLCGPAGIGKTALAVEVAHRLRERFPDGRFHVALRGFDTSGPPLTPVEGMRRLLHALGAPVSQLPEDTEDVDAHTGLYRSLTAGRRILLVLDDAHDAAQVRPLLPAAAGSLTLVTSRRQLSSLVTEEAARRVVLAPLAPAESRAFLRGRIRSEGLGVGPQAVEELVARCAGSPGALSLATGRDLVCRDLVPSQDVRTDRSALSPAGGPEAVHGAADRPPHALTPSYRALGTGAARLFRLLALYRGTEIDAEVAASLCGVEPRGARVLLDELADLHLVTEETMGRFTLPASERRYAATVVREEESAPARGEAVRRLLVHLLATARAVSRTLERPGSPPRPGTEPALDVFPDAGAAWRWYLAERRGLVEAVRQATREPAFPAWQFVEALEPMWHRAGHWSAWSAAAQEASEAARRAGDLPGVARTRHSLGRVHALLGRQEEALTALREALDLFTVCGDLCGAARVHRDLAVRDDEQGRHEGSLRHACSARELYARAGDRRGEAHASYEVGRAHERLGAVDEAMSCYDRSARLNRELDDPLGEATAWDALGDVHRRQNYGDQARACYERASALLTEHDPAAARHVDTKLGLPG